MFWIVGGVQYLSAPSHCKSGFESFESYILAISMTYPHRHASNSTPVTCVYFVQAYRRKAHLGIQPGHKCLIIVLPCVLSNQLKSIEHNLDNMLTFEYIINFSSHLC